MSLVHLPKIRITHHFRRCLLKDCGCQTDISHNFRSKFIIKFFTHIHPYHELQGNHRYQLYSYHITKLESLEFYDVSEIETCKFGLRFKDRNAHDMEVEDGINFKIKFK